MSSVSPLQASIEAAHDGLTLAELLTRHPEMARRTAQRHLSALVEHGLIQASGEGRSRRYHRVDNVPESHARPPSPAGAFPDNLPLSADSQDILAYIDQPLSQRTPVGYQRDFLEAYQPNRSWYLAEPLRRQLHQIGKTADIDQAAGTYSRAILNRLLIDLSWASSHLEGNTYTRLDTRELITHGKAAVGKAAIETQMILNHKAAIELLVENIEHVGFNRYTVMNLHSTLAENLLPNPADEGRIRQHPVDIGQSVYRPLSAPQQLDEALDLMLAKADQILDPFEQSFFLMVHLPYLQPFSDINKRTSRLVANLPLFRANLCPLTFLDVPESAYSLAMLGVYEMTRVELLRDLYIWAYQRSAQEYLAIRQGLVEPDPLRLAWRNLIKTSIHGIVTQGLHDPLPFIRETVQVQVPEAEQMAVQALIIEELRRLHEGVLARYGLRPAEYEAYRKVLTRTAQEQSTAQPSHASSCDASGSIGSGCRS
ncbi:MAG: Fic family protein [Lautropia sp.]|nr:Fic family protein [Lautropia sp.]